MLVSPLMTPIIGISLGIVIGRHHLLGMSLRTVALGVAIAIFFSGLIGFLPLEVGATSEMLSRTRPTILDLLVAVLAGFAGSYAMIDERISPALPGVAIATAIVPPLSNTGICLSFGYYYGAFGSFMLFFANFLSILLVAGTTFMLAGLSPWWISISTKDLLKRFGIAMLGFIAVAVFLTYSLVGIVRERQLEKTVKHILESSITELHATSLDNFIHHEENGKLYVLADIKSPRTITPHQVETVQKKIEEQTRKPTEVIFRNLLVKDVSALGTSEKIVRQNLDGDFIQESPAEWQIAVNIVEQQLLVKLAHWPGTSLLDVDYVEAPGAPVVIATIESYRNLTKSEIEEIQNELRKNMNNKNMYVLVKNLETALTNMNGHIIPGYVYGGFTEEQEKMRNNLENAIINKFNQYPDIIPLDIHYKPSENSWDVLVETIGTSNLSPEEIGQFENELSEMSGMQIRLSLWHKTDIAITKDGFLPFDEFNEENVKRLDKYFREKAKEK